MYTPSARTYNSRFVGNNISDNPAIFICQFYVSVGGSPEQCMQYLSMLKDVPLPSGADATLGGILSGHAQ
jgi:hypothetical protein